MHVKEVNIKNRIYNYYFEILSKEKTRNKKIFINKKNYKDLVIYITRYVYKKSIKMLCLYYHELIKKIEEHEKKNIQ